MTSSASRIERIARGDVFAAWDAAEDYREDPRPEDLPALIEAYRVRRETGLRMEIVDLIGLVGTPEACAFLLRVARSRTDRSVRYDAMRNLIELDRSEWRPDSPRKLRTELYESLLVYERYRKGEISLDALRSIGRERMAAARGYWEWFTHLEPRFGEDPTAPMRRRIESRRPHP